MDPVALRPPLANRSHLVRDVGIADVSEPVEARDFGEYAALRRIVARSHLFEKRRLAYFPRIASNFVLLGLSQFLLIRIPDVGEAVHHQLLAP